MKAIAVFTSKINGFVTFEEKGEKVLVTVQLSGLKLNGLHGFHVHQAGDLSDGCESMCAHFNPFNKNHGCPGMSERHVGDLGNLVSDIFGNANYTFYDNVIKLNGIANIIGRGLIIHADQDDCGNGGNKESLKTGNAGKRIACAVIGYAKCQSKMYLIAG